MLLDLEVLWCIKQNVIAIFFSNSFKHCHAEQIKKGVICVQILLDRLNTVESIFKVKKFHLHTNLGLSNVVFIL